MPIFLAAGVAAGISTVAWLLRALTGRGAVAAAVIGTLILWPAGWPGCAVLGTYFGLTTLVSRLAAAVGRPSEQTARERRDARQVVANGGAAALGALLEFRTPGAGIWVVTIGLAGAAADTWATAFGSLSPRPPRDLLRLRRVAPGTSGGVTWFGSSGGVTGAAMVGLAGTVVTGSESLFLVAAVAGSAAMLLDSALGSALQAGYHCPRCDTATELPIHTCGGTTTLARGLRWLDNDLVNASATTFATLAGTVAWWAGAR